MKALIFIVLSIDLSICTDPLVAGPPRSKCTCGRDCLYDKTDSRACLMDCLANSLTCEKKDLDNILEFAVGESSPASMEEEKGLGKAPGVIASDFCYSKLGYPYTYDHSQGFGPT